MATVDVKGLRLKELMCDQEVETISVAYHPRKP